MNNKGFIATSLIYSFFLIFITLFLTIIADYLQNKVLLNTIENGIKDNINNTKSIEDFDVGDIIHNASGSDMTISSTVLPIDSYWIVAGMLYQNDDAGIESKLILYSIDTYTTSPSLSLENIENDLNLTGNYNETRKNELINIPRCTADTSTNPIQYNCNGTISYRQRIEITPFDGYFSVNPDSTDGNIDVLGVTL